MKPSDYALVPPTVLGVALLAAGALGVIVGLGWLYMIGRADVPRWFTVRSASLDLSAQQTLASLLLVFDALLALAGVAILTFPLATDAAARFLAR